MRDIKGRSAFPYIKHPLLRVSTNVRSHYFTLYTICSTIKNSLLNSFIILIQDTLGIFDIFILQDRDTALQKASASGDVAVVDMLLKAGANPSTTNMVCTVSISTQNKNVL